MDDALAAYFAAWNEPDADERRRLLGRSVTDDAQLIGPTGCRQGVDGLVERIGRYHTAAPGARVVPASGVDAHSAVARYAWRIIDLQGRHVMDGLDVAERIGRGSAS